MKNYSKLIISVFVITFTLPGFASPDQAVLENTTIDYSVGQSALSATDRQKIREVLKKAKTQGKIARIEVAVWSDKGHPVKGDLAKADRNLAQERGQLIEDQIKQDLGQYKSIKVFNMAESSNWLTRLFQTQTAQLDEAFAKGGEVAREDFNLIKEKGAPSKAVVVVNVRK